MDAITTTWHGGLMNRTLLTTLVVALLAPAAAAKANTYDVYACWAGYGTFHNPNASTAAWARDDAAAGGHFEIDDACRANPTSGAVSLMSLGGFPASQGEYAQLKFAAP